MKTPDVPKEKPSAPNKRDFIIAESLKARIQAGEFVGALDYPEADRPLFWAAMARVRDDLPCVKPTWRTIGEQHVDGIRTRQQLFRICPRQKGVIDATLAGLITLAAVCAADRWPAVSRPNEWRIAHRIAREIPNCTGATKHQAISMLLATLLDLLRSAGT